MAVKKALSPSPSLVEFAAAHSKPECVVCALPEREEIDAAYRQGITRRPILKWLWEVKGYAGVSNYDEAGKPTGLSASALDKHLTGAHHLRPTS